MSERPQDPSTSSFEDRYKVVGFLGQGGTGLVYKALQRTTGQMVAIKTLRFDGNDAEGAERLLRSLEREMTLIGYLDSPHIVRLYDSGVTPNGFPFIALEYVSGITLRELVKKGPLAPELALRMMRQVLEALAEAHEHTIVHRDLKPENIMISIRASRLHTRVLDFGISALVEESLAGGTVGTPCYMPPEHIEGSASVTPAGDVYAAGLILFEALTGQKAFDGESAEVVLAHQLATPLLLPEAFVGTPIGAILERATAKRFYERYEDASEMLADLDTIDPSSLPLFDGALDIETIAAIESNVIEAAKLEQEAVDSFDHSQEFFLPNLRLKLAETTTSGMGSPLISPPRTRWLLAVAIGLGVATICLTIVVIFLVSLTDDDNAQAAVEKTVAEKPVATVVEAPKAKVEPVQEVVAEEPKPVVENNPLSDDELKVDELLGLARQAHREGRVEEAISYYEEAVVLAPENRAAREELGWVYLKLERFKDAVDVFVESLKENIDSENLLLGLALAQLGAAEHDDARDSFRRYLELFPDSERKDEINKHLEAIEEVAPEKDRRKRDRHKRKLQQKKVKRIEVFK
ncbi:MAG: hypothetical protein AUK47_12400 [Deltaproteobacteria bacterium CG2_30_63_29]|nr:MAG: hypothetical protein AUK47_12400 [Deltaproteobacteria bacterium CG2_30_63_29]PJB40980.1 MAG: hypothetical protein CO108_13780 [Deltaproteobacteria bacterium CG_4_9_14_3_um_filter_63_12]